MPRPRTATNVLKMQGAFKKDPQREREDAPLAGPIGDAPGHMCEEAKRVWDEMVRNAPIGVLGASDRVLLEVTCNMIVDQRREGVEYPPTKVNTLKQLLGQLGFTPATRSTVGGSRPEKKNKFAD